MTLRARLLLLILLAALPTMAIEAYSEAELRSTRQEEIRQEALRLMRLVTAEQERIDESARQLLVGFSEGEEVHAQDWMHCSETAKQVLARVDGYVNIGIASADGDLLCSGLPPLPDKNMRRQNFLEEMTPSGNLLLGRYHVGLITGNAVLMVAVPLPTERRNRAARRMGQYRFAMARAALRRSLQLSKPDAAHSRQPRNHPCASAR